MTMNDFRWVLIVFGLICFGFICIIQPIAYAYSDTTTTITTKKLEHHGGDDKYLVFTENEVFENTDSLMFWKFNSSDIYNEMEEGKTYKVKVAGWRIPFLSMYRNIISAEETNSP